ncbi:hypothetical protein ACFPIJ_56000 [Dactylosporangium cerinum]|uniref:Uncharacterized protein n=1 Tax=Dactylosporangium cerinum TaxID=1434730 RepID=A0ABV9WHT7_9ACTN
MDLDDLLPAARSPADYLRVLDDLRLDDSGLAVLAGSPYSFVRLAVARHQRAAAPHLRRLLEGEYTDWDSNAVLLLVARHAGADRPVLPAVLDRVTELLRAGARPYAAALTLAERPELRSDEIRPLGRLAGASRRMRRGLNRALAARTPPSA